MKITLDSNPDDAPGCLKLVSEDGRDLLIQTDLEWPGIATTFGWSLHDHQPEEPENYTEEWRHDLGLQSEEIPIFERFDKQCDCVHEKTDGSVSCPDCGITAGKFIAAAREWLDDHDGAETEDPGYFSEA